jgi:hypothetical protein
VDLARFDAAPDGASVRIEWETATEIDNLGFALYRADSADGPQTRLNDSLIPGQEPGSPAGAVYAYLDENVLMGATYCYWLEDLDVYGVATVHGPVCARMPRAHKLVLPRPRMAPKPVRESS